MSLTLFYTSFIKKYVHYEWLPMIKKKTISLLTYAVALVSFIVIGVSTYHLVSIKKQQQKTAKYTFSLEQKSELAEKMNRAAIRLIAIIVIAFTLMCLLFLIRHYTFFAVGWITGTFFSLLCALGIVLIWYLEITNGSTKKQENIVETQEQVDQFFAFYTKKYPLTNIHYLPVGFVIYSLDLDQNLVTFFAYPWIKYNLVKDKDLTGEFYISNANKEVHTTPNTIVQKDYKVLGWQSEVKFNEKFDYSKYPFDLQQIVFKMNHAQWSGNNILVPDFKGYTGATIADPQLDPDLEINKWTIVNAYFFYALSNWQSNFGIDDFDHQKNFPYLSYTIEIQRNFFTPLATTLLPIVIILFLVFSAIIIFPSLKEPRSSINTIISLLSGMFFSTIVAQQTFDRTLNTSAITYFACFYYLVYIVIFLAAINCLFFAYREDYILQWRNNVLARMLYWPTIMLTFFIITLYFFY